MRLGGGIPTEKLVISMAVKGAYLADVEMILSHRHDLGWDCWTTPDKRLIKGSPFSAYNSALMLLELGMEPSEPILQGVVNLFWEAWREDGRFKLYPSGGIYPCHTALGAQLCAAMGYAGDPRMQKTYQHLLDIRHRDGGLRCNKFSFGRGPETEFSNPFPTLTALDAFRYSEHPAHEPELDQAVEFLLAHWRIRKPIGPCHYGMGTLFMQVEYPFGNYNLFQYVYVLSFYRRARQDKRFLEALAALQAKLVDGQVVVERNSPKLSKLSFCKKGLASPLATKRYGEILRNLG
jgi:hypothetical protein